MASKKKGRGVVQPHGGKGVLGEVGPPSPILRVGKVRGTASDVKGGASTSPPPGPTLRVGTVKDSARAVGVSSAVPRCDCAGFFFSGNWHHALGCPKTDVLWKAAAGVLGVSAWPCTCTPVELPSCWIHAREPVCVAVGNDTVHTRVLAEHRMESQGKDAWDFPDTLDEELPF